MFLELIVLQVMTALPTVQLDPPTISMTFGVNDSPLAGRDGTHVSSKMLPCLSIVVFPIFLQVVQSYFCCNLILFARFSPHKCSI